MQTLKVTELFYSIQGEGARQGQPSLFVRLTGCDMACGFCDTEFVSGSEIAIDELAAAIKKSHPDADWIVWTGGEPMLQLNKDVVDYFHAMGYKQAIETNGAHSTEGLGLDWVCVSPKVAEHVMQSNFPSGVDELRYVRHKGQLGIPKPAVTAKRYFISPMFKGNRPDPENMAHCIRLVLANPKWTLSVQLHKLMNVL